MGIFDLFSGKIEIKETGKKYKTIAKAIEAASDGDTILIPPGIYKESFEINKKVNIEGDDSDIPVIWSETLEQRNVITITAECSLRNIRVQGAQDSCPDSYEYPEEDREDLINGEPCCILIKNSCKITNVNVCFSAGYGIGVVNENACPVISGGSVTSNYSSGVNFSDGAGGTLSEVRISKNRCGVSVYFEAKPKIYKCEILENRNGVLGDHSHGKVERCEIHSNEIGISFDCSKTIVDGCKVYENKEYGIKCEGISDEKIQGSRFENNENGVQIEGGANPYFSYCSILASKCMNVCIEGGKGLFENCGIKTSKSHNVFVKYEESKPIFKKCDITSAATASASGMYFTDHALGIVEDCSIWGSEENGVEILDFSNPVVSKCDISLNTNSNVYVCENGFGEFNDCEITSSKTRQGIYVATNGSPKVKKCTIKGNGQNGVFVKETGKGLFNECAILSNKRLGVHIKDDTEACFKNCKIFDNATYGVGFKGKLVGGEAECGNQPISSLEDCVIYHNGTAAIKEIDLAHYPDLKNVWIGEPSKVEIFEGCVIESRMLTKGSDYEDLVKEVERKKSQEKQQEKESKTEETFHAERKIAEESFLAKQNEKRNNVREVVPEIVKREVCMAERSEISQNGLFTDPRDGNTYKTVKIGNQVWMAENLRYQGDFARDGEGSFVYDNDPSNEKTYGRLYTWTAAMNIAPRYSDCQLPFPVRKKIEQGKYQGIAPDGWHIPSKEEFETLLKYVGGNAFSRLSVPGEWDTSANLTDSYGFSALPAGGCFHNIEGRHFDYLGRDATFWSSSASDFGANVLNFDDDSARINCHDKKNGYSVRCLQD